MKEISEYLSENKIASIRDAAEVLDAKLSMLEREAASYLIVDFPNKHRFEEIAASLLSNLKSEMVQVNSLSSTAQTTVVTAPPGLVTRIPVGDSLCFITVASGESLMASDIANDETFEGSYVKDLWGSWASAPIVIRGLDAGSVCVLQHGARVWTDEDRNSLQATASSIASEIDNWLSDKDN